MRARLAYGLWLLAEAFQGGEGGIPGQAIKSVWVNCTQIKQFLFLRGGLTKEKEKKFPKKRGKGGLIKGIVPWIWRVCCVLYGRFWTRGKKKARNPFFYFDSPTFVIVFLSVKNIFELKTRERKKKLFIFHFFENKNKI